ncbi:hypothetical protein PanWU01x14_278740 [Parasponia andersonii]|uniref:Uncharacterized protein n=1 Tax=Parasponia andersonii TaxID=3476 RepID=A0A2P5B239_PARAD|nr:hypothetical protein PanWU01x14_278740 [Parasponia andersonii]
MKSTYRSRNKKTRKQVPEAEKEGHNNGSNLVSRGQSNNHHPIQCEVDEAHQYVIVEPQEFPYFPLKPNHGVKEKSVNYSLNCCIDCLYQHLKKI